MLLKISLLIEVYCGNAQFSRRQHGFRIK